MVTVADDADLDLASTMTLEAWVKAPSTNASWQTVMMKEAPPWTPVLRAWTRPRWHSEPERMGGRQRASTRRQPPLNQWTHLAFTLENGVGRFYRNGTLVSQASEWARQPPTNGVLRIGGNSIWPDEGFKG